MRTYDRRASSRRCCARPLASRRRRLAASRTLHYYNWIDYVTRRRTPRSRRQRIAVRKSYYASNKRSWRGSGAGARLRPRLLRPGTWWRRSRRKGSCTGSTGSSCATSERPSTRGSSAFRTTDDRWSAQGLGHHELRVPHRQDRERPVSWAQFFALFERYARKLTLLDGATEVIGSVAVMLGYSFNTESEGSSSACEDSCRCGRSCARSTRAGTRRHRLDRRFGGMGWNGDGAYVIARARNGAADYVVPKEGGELWVDAHVIPKGRRIPQPARGSTSCSSRRSARWRACILRLAGEALLLAPILAPTSSEPRRLPARRLDVQALQPSNLTPKGAAARERIWAEVKAAR